MGITNKVKPIIEKNKMTFIRIGVYFIVLLLAYMPFMNPVMASDYIPIAENRGMISPPRLGDFVSGGRFCTYFILWIYYFLSKLYITHYTRTFVLQLMGMVLYTISAYLIYTMVNDNSGARIGITDIVISIAFINPLMVETYLWGAFDWGLGIFFAVLGAKMFEKKKYVLCFLFGFVAISIYQSNIFIMLIICLTVTVIKGYRTNDLKALYRFVEIGIGCLFVAAANIGIQKILLSTGQFGEVVKDAVLPSDIMEFLFEYFELTWDIYQIFYGMYPRYFLPIFLISALVFGIVGLALQKRKKFILMWGILVCALVMIPTSISLVVRHLLFAPRIALSMMFSVSLILLTLGLIVKQNGRMVCIYQIGIVLYIVFNFYCTSTCVTDRYIAQALDQYEVRSIQGEIDKYEDATGNKVDTIVSRHDPEVTYTLPELQIDYHYNTYNHRIMYKEWAQGGYLGYVNNIDYEYRLMTEEEYIKYFGEKNWDTYIPSEQLVFEDNVLYWAIY